MLETPLPGSAALQETATGMVDPIVPPAARPGRGTDTTGGVTSSASRETQVAQPPPVSAYWFACQAEAGSAGSRATPT